jgi:hypothetical protein
MLRQQSFITKDVRQAGGPLLVGFQCCLFITYSRICPPYLEAVSSPSTTFAVDAPFCGNKVAGEHGMNLFFFVTSDRGVRVSLNFVSVAVFLVINR